MDTLNKTSENSEAPQGMERRMVLRLLSQWRVWQEDDKFPSFASVDPEEIPEMWSHCFVLDFLDNEDNPVVRMVGPALSAFLPHEISDLHLSDVPANTLLEHAASYYPEILRRGVPISRGGEFRKYDGKKVLYRSIIMPMSDDGHTISGLLGAANCREVAGD